MSAGDYRTSSEPSDNDHEPSYRDEVVLLQTDHVSHLDVPPPRLLKPEEQADHRFDIFVCWTSDERRNLGYCNFSKTMSVFKDGGFICIILIKANRNLCSHAPSSRTSHFLLLISLSILCRAWKDFNLKVRTKPII